MRIPIYRTVEVRDNPGIPMSVPRYRISLVKETEMEWPTKKMQCAGDAYEMAKVIFEDYDRESVYVFMLDQSHKILGINLVSMGSLTESLVHPRELFKAIILVNAAAFVMVHNHPSGDPTPSMADRQLTARIKSVATLMGIRMLDSIVAGDESYYSFAESGALDSLPSDVIRLGEAGEFKWGENPRRRMMRDSRKPFIARDTQEPLVVLGGYRVSETGGLIHEASKRRDGGDYGADPLPDGRFRMVPSGDIVDFEERNRRLEE